MAYPKHPLPFFPLPDLVFFPGAIQPLQIFEPRYLRMIEDVLDSSGHLVLGTVLGDNREDMSGCPPTEPMAGLGVLQDYQRLPDGRFLILVYGKARVLVHEVESDRMYRQVGIEVIDDEKPIRNENVARALIREAIVERAGDDVRIPDDVSTAQLTDLLLMQLELPASTLYEIYSVRSLATRVKRSLESHAALKE